MSTNFLDSILKYSGWVKEYKFNAASNDDQPISPIDAETIYVDQSAPEARAFTLHIEIKDTLAVGKQRFYNATDTSKQYIFKIPMQVVNDVPAGTKTFEMALSGNSTSTVFAKEGNMNAEWSGQWDKYSSGGTADHTNMKNYFHFNGNPDLFPAAEVPTGATASLSNLDKLTNGQPIEGLKDLKVHVTYPTKPAMDKNPTKIGYGNAGLTDNDVASLTEITTP